MKIYLTGAIAGVHIDAIGEFQQAQQQLLDAGHDVSSALDYALDADNREYPNIIKHHRATKLIGSDLVVALDNYEHDVDSLREVAFARHLEIPVRPLIKVLENTQTIIRNENA